MKFLKTGKLLTSVAFAILFAGGAGFSQAATISVNTTTDELVNPGTGCSLREAIQSVNNGANFGGCTHTGNYGSSDIINVPAGTYTTTITGSGDDSNASGDYDILASVSIVGAGAGATTIDGNGGTINDRVFDVHGAITASFSGVTITNGKSTDCAPSLGGLGSCGGAILSNNEGNADLAGTVNITNSVISNSTATSGFDPDGGGIFNSGTQRTLNVTNSTINNNSTTYGGGIAGGGTISIIGSTVTGNSASYYGGGIYTGATITIANSTLFGNSTGGGGYTGAAIISFNSLTITNSTISGNSGASAVDGYAGTTTISNSIVANQSSGADCSSGGSGGTVSSGGYNLESATSCGFTGTGDQQSSDPLLDALNDNGGPTQTMALSVSSPAKNAGSNAICAASPVSGRDQRGYVRPYESQCDIGAFEYGSSLPAPPPVPATTPIPTLSEWALIMLVGLLGVSGLLGARRKI